MKNTKKIFGAASVLGAIVIGAVLYNSASDNPTYFKGLAPMESARMVSEYAEEEAEAVTMEDFAHIIVANKRRIRARIPEASSTLRASVLTLPVVASPCKGREHAVIIDGAIAGCARDDEPDSCESIGKFTYRGPDKPGLLYGMCSDDV